MTATNKSVPQEEPEELEALLPWHATGTLSARDARRVEDALARSPALARQYSVIRDEYAETIHLNESLGAPSASAMQKLFAAIDAEPARVMRSSPNLSTRVAQFFAGLSPRATAAMAAAAAIVLLLQAGVIGTILVKDRAGSGYETAAYQGGQKSAGVVALVRFAPDARMADIGNLLGTYNASIIDGPKAGMFRVMIGDKALSKDEAAKLISRIQSEKIVGFVAIAE